MYPYHQRAAAFGVRGLGARGLGSRVWVRFSLEMYAKQRLSVLELVTGLEFLTFSDVVGSIS